MRIGEDRFRLVGELRGDRPIVVPFVQMMRAGDVSGETFRKLRFGPGRHALRFEARIVGWPDRAESLLD